MKYQPKKQKGGLKASLISLAVTLVFGAVYYYFALPALNLHSGDFYTFVILLCVVYAVCKLILTVGIGIKKNAEIGASTFKNVFKVATVPSVIVIVTVAVAIIGSLTGAKLFRANDYASLLTVSDGDFASEVAEIDWDQIPMLDSTSANNLANRKLGELSDLVSQFVVSESSSQINYKGSPVRVTYLAYTNFFKWLSNRDTGIPAYMTIDMRTQEVTVVRLEEGIKYSPSEYFNRNLYRHLRFKYPTLMFDNINFEIDENGTPYWLASVVEKKIGLFGGTDVVGGVLVNAITGECQYLDLDEVPAWVDRLYAADLIVEQYDYRGLYSNGFFNALFSQSGCTQTTYGYNYIVLGDDVWMYTGVTSVTSDEGNIGFILVNQRTKEAKYYSCAGAEEYSAMSSAEGAVQQYSYQSTFPLLLNVSDQPTYFMALKDGAGLVKMYAMVNVRQYQLVATGYTLEECNNNYLNLLASNNLVDGELQITPDTLTVSGEIADIRTANIEGNTYFYIRLTESDSYFAVSAKDYPEVILLNVGDTVAEIEYAVSEAVIKDVVSLTVE